MDAVVIGGGHAGLAVSQRLGQLGLDHVVLERGRIAESWRGQRWDSFALNTPSWLNRLPGDSDTDVGVPSDGFLSKAQLVERLVAYTNRWDLPVSEGVNVTRIERPSSNGHYRVYTDRAEDATIEARSVIVASGAMNVPRIPPIASRLPSRLVQVSALDYQRPDQLPAGAVLVVGAGQSGGQIVEDLLKAGRPVYWSVSAVVRQPRRYRGRDILAWLYDSGFFDATLEQVSDPAVRNATIPLVSGIGRYGHTLSLQWLAGKGARLVGRIQRIDDGVLHLDDRVAECIRFGDRRALEICDEIDDFIRDSGQTPSALEDDEANVAHPDPDAVRSPARLDLAALDVESVVWATGVSGDFSYLPPGSTDPRGVPLQHHGVSPLDGLFYAGLPWMTHRSSGILHGPERDAAPVASRVAARSAA